MMETYTVHPKDLDMPNTTLIAPDLSAFTRSDDLGLKHHSMWPDHGALLAASVMRSVVSTLRCQWRGAWTR